MGEQRYSLKKYGDYPVILDGEKELTLDSVVELLNKKDFDDKLFTKEWNAENTSQLMKLDYELEKAQKEKDSLVRVIDKNLLKGYHEQSLKHKEAKEKMEHKDERMEASALIDAVFYWNGYVKALEELKEGMTDE